MELQETRGKLGHILVNTKQPSDPPLPSPTLLLHNPHPPPPLFVSNSSPSPRSNALPMGKVGVQYLSHLEQAKYMWQALHTVQPNYQEKFTPNRWKEGRSENLAYWSSSVITCSVGRSTER